MKELPKAIIPNIQAWLSIAKTKQIAPTKQPFICIHFTDIQVNGLSGEWYVDVGGKVGVYLRNGRRTKLMEYIIAEFKKVGRVVDDVRTYSGTAAPTHLLRGNSFYRRVSLDDPVAVVSHPRLDVSITIQVPPWDNRSYEKEKLQ